MSDQNKKNIIATASLSFVFLMLAIILNFVFVKNNQPEQIASKLEKALHEKEGLLIDLLQKEIARDDNNNFGNVTAYEGLYEKEGIIVLIYDNETLEFWSENVVPAPERLEPRFFSERVHHFKNGWFEIIMKPVGKKTYIGLILIKNDYAYENDYLVNEFQKAFPVPPSAEIFEGGSQYEIFSIDQQYLFSLDFQEHIPLHPYQENILFCLYLVSLLLFFAFTLLLYKYFKTFFKKRWVLFFAFVIDIVIIRFLIAHFNIPHALYQSALFSPEFYGSSTMLPSLGDLIINAFVFLFIAYAFSTLILTNPRISTFSALKRYTVSFVLFLIILLGYGLLISLFKGLIIDSSISLKLINVFGLTTESYLGIIAVATLLLGFYIFSQKLVDFIYYLSASTRSYTIILITALVVACTVFCFKTGRIEVFYVFFIFIYLFSLWYVRKRRIKRFSYYYVVFNMIIFAVFSTYTLHKFERIKEQEERKLMAVRLTTERDKIIEYMFNDVEKNLLADTVLAKNLRNALLYDDQEERTIEYIVDNYLYPFRSSYHFQLTICNSQRVLEIQPENYIIACYDYFEDVINRLGEPTASPGLFYLDDGSDDVNYIAALTFGEHLDDPDYPVNVYIELYSKYVPKALGYPELLVDKKASSFIDLTNYSYAIYGKGELVKSVGKYFYSIKGSVYGGLEDDFLFFDRNGYDHLNYKADETTNVIISLKKQSFIEILAPFSFLLIFYGIYILIFLAVSNFSIVFVKKELNFRTRMQVAIVSIMLVSFLVIGISSLYYIIGINNDKNLDALSEKAHSVLIEIEHKLADTPGLSPDMEDYLESLLTKFSLVFFSDINIYNINGNLLASSRPEIFKEGLISTKMNAVAFNQLAHYNKTLFIHQEKIGVYDYLSAYVPFRNNRNELIAYLNLPYFAREGELRQEISTFMIAFTNIYIILIAISILTMLLISNYITFPLQLIRDKLRKLKLGRPNEKIKWVRKDEIGNLVIEYNRMIDKLAQSAELLAQSERESAWREMAKQVAHEIKNPLTPMKLSTQYLQKAWDEQAPDWDQRLKKFSKAIIQQIDNLSVIASEFSDFAKMPQSMYEKIEIDRVITASVDLFKESRHVDFRFIKPDDHLYYVYADKKQMLQVFNNLFKNSIQAKKDSEDEMIEISIEQQTADHYLIKVTDNGIGISRDQADKIFSPNFTTKTGGMGLGLAIVKSIILDSGGKIWFESEEGVGTTFFIQLPVYSVDSQ
ncbi:MAG: GHKL domain-containing protein [Bacteroidales bacterium]|nr:GHKL domain-containing protein [Bacteroidales bacterium]